MEGSTTELTALGPALPSQAHHESAAWMKVETDSAPSPRLWTHLLRLLLCSLSPSPFTIWTVSSVRQRPVCSCWNAAGAKRTLSAPVLQEGKVPGTVTAIPLTAITSGCRVSETHALCDWVDSPHCILVHLMSHLLKLSDEDLHWRSCPLRGHGGPSFSTLCSETADSGLCLEHFVTWSHGPFILLMIAEIYSVLVWEVVYK